MRILLTGAAGKVGSNLLPALLERRADAAVVALCHNRLIPETSRVNVVRGNIADRSTAESAMAGVTHVVHMATCKDTPDEVMDVAVKGMFWLLEAFRQNPSARQFILIGGDAGVGHFFYPHADPVTEKTPHMAYPGCYALSKVLEEVMLEQYRIQYGLNTCCLRAPWIMEKDDFRYSLSFGDDIFGGPDWKSWWRRNRRQVPEPRRHPAAAGCRRENPSSAISCMSRIWSKRSCWRSITRRRVANSTISAWTSR